MMDESKDDWRKAESNLKDEGVIEDKVEKHREKFEDKFKENMFADVPKHPYKIYRDIVEQNELTDEEKVALEQMKDEFSEQWQSLKQTHSTESDIEKFRKLEESVLQDNSENKISKARVNGLEGLKTIGYIIISSSIILSGAIYSSISVGLIGLGSLIGSIAHFKDIKERFHQ